MYTRTHDFLHNCIFVESIYRFTCFIPLIFIAIQWILSQVQKMFGGGKAAEKKPIEGTTSIKASEATKGESGDTFVKSSKQD